MAKKGDTAPTAVRAGLRRLAAGTRPPPSAGRANAPGMDVREKNRTAMTTVDGHGASATLFKAFTQIVGAAPGNGRTVDPASGVALWVAGRAPVLAKGPQGTADLSEREVAAQLAPVDGQFWTAVNARLDAMRGGLDQRAVDLPGLPPLGEEGDVPPPERSAQLAVVRERARDYRQWAGYCRQAELTQDRVLAAELVSLALSQTQPGGPWFKGPRYEKVHAWVAELREFFRTPKVAAGEVNTTLTELQRANLDALETELNNPAVAERLPVLLYNHAFPWLEAPDVDQDPAERYDRIMQLAGKMEGDVAQQLDASGERLVALDAEAPGPVQLTGDRGGPQV